MATFKAILIRKTDDGQSVGLADFDEKDLMDGDVTVRVEWSSLNYKDGLALTGKAPVVRRFPMIPGIDFAGMVEASEHPDWKPGDRVILNGWGLGETHLGAYAEKARVKGDWLVPMPAGMTGREAMAIGTAGYTAMLAVLALERHGVTPERGPVVVTGAAGGVGSVAVALLAKLGYQVTASTGRPEEADYLKRLGAAEVIDRAGTGRAGAAARQGALGRRHRCGRLDHARQRPVHDPLRRRGRGLRACRRHGPADLRSRPSFCAQCHFWASIPSLSAERAPRGLETLGFRPRPRQTPGNDAGNRLGRGGGGGPEPSSTARSAGGLWSRLGKRVQNFSTIVGHDPPAYG